MSACACASSLAHVVVLVTDVKPPREDAGDSDDMARDLMWEPEHMVRRERENVPCHASALSVRACAQVFHKMDSTIANMVADEGRGLVVAVNKWDLLGEAGSMRRGGKKVACAALERVRRCAQSWCPCSFAK